ncbi:MAG: type II toxin-antitoxin system VapC family toxin [Candidatus Dormibacteria bacterium]
MRQVLDASALLAFWLDEPGGEAVEAAMVGGAAISTVNLGEALARLVRDRPDLADKLAGTVKPEASPPWLTSLGAGEGLMLPGSLTVEPFTLGDAVNVAVLVPSTRAAGLSFGDRACLALGRRLGWPVLTADRSWARLDVGVTGVEVRMLRHDPEQA